MEICFQKGKKPKTQVLIFYHHFYQETHAVRIGAKADVHSEIASEILAQQLEKKGYFVKRIYHLEGIAALNAFLAYDFDVYVDSMESLQALLWVPSFEDLCKKLQIEVWKPFPFFSSYSLITLEQGVTTISEWLQRHQKKRIGIDFELSARKEWKDFFASYLVHTSVEVKNFEASLGYIALENGSIDAHGLDLLVIHGLKKLEEIFYLKKKKFYLAIASTP